MGNSVTSLDYDNRFPPLVTSSSMRLTTNPRRTRMHRAQDTLRNDSDRVGEPLPSLHGAPLRLRVETELGLRYGRPHDIVTVS